MKSNPLITKNRLVVRDRSAMTPQKRSKLNAFIVFLSALPLSMAIAFPAKAAIPVAGWGYSLGNALYIGAGGDPGDPYVITKGWGWLIDPPSIDTIISGRATLKFDPNLTVLAAGWLGDFGANPTISAPPVGSSFISENQIQGPSPSLLTSSISIDQLNGLATFDYDWGPSGFLPATLDHFNFAAIVFDDSTLSAIPASSLVTRENAGVAAPYGIVGTSALTANLGTNLPTYMLCSKGYCGISVPGPLPILGLGAVFAYSRKLRKRVRSNG